MKTTYISTLALSDAARSRMMKQASLINKLQVEQQSGRKADVGLDLGSRTGESVNLRSEFHFLHSIIDTNALVKSRLDVSQKAMDDIRKDAEAFLATLITVRDGEDTASVARVEAEAGLELLMSRLNTRINGNYLFAGLNTDVVPVNDYFAAGSPNKVAADAAFLAEFGIAQTDPAVSGITPAAMTTYLNGNFENLFDAPAWETDWSSASNQKVVSRISTSEEIGTSISANEQAFRDLAAAYTMVADLGSEALDQDTFKVVLDKAIEKLSSGASALTDHMGEIGIAQERTVLASERLTVQTTILNKRVNALESVNPEETFVRLSTALTQLEVSYAISARIQQLSIVNFI